MSVGVTVATITGTAVASLSLLGIAITYYISRRQEYKTERMRIDIERVRLDRESRPSYTSKEPNNVSPSLISELLSRQNAVLDRLESVTISPSLLHDILARENSIIELLQSQAVQPQLQRDYIKQQEALLARMNEVASAIPGQSAQTKATERPSKDQIELMQELAHSLNTPLSQIEAASLVLQDGPQENSAPAGDSKSAASRIYQSAEICKAFLSAFMQITKVASQTSKWNPKSLDASLRAAAELYADQTRSSVKSSIYVGVEPRGYSASYILAVTLPLLENAFESATTGSTVSVDMTAEQHEYKIQVTSAYDAIPEVDSMYNTGFTTKEGHQGVGLSIVRRLLSAYYAAQITHAITDGQITFTISLPRG